VVNLIPYNKTDVKDALSCPSETQMLEFQKVVQSYGLFCTIRRTMGADIAGACGQLVVEEENYVQRDLVDIEDGPFQKKDEQMEKQERPIELDAAKRRNDDEETDNEDFSNGDGLDLWVRRLTVATIIAATGFVISSSLLLSLKCKHR
jgi:sorting nexin-8